VPEGLKPLGGRAWWAIAAVAAVMVTDVLVIWSDVLEIDLMSRLSEDGEVLIALSPEAFDEVDANDNRQLVVTAIWALAWILATVFFIRWFWSAYSNLRVLGQPRTRFHPAWGIVSWFIPIFGLWRPKQMANDIWRGSRPDAPTLAAHAWKTVPVPALLGWWWAAWIVTSTLSNYGGRLWWDADTVESIGTAAKIDVAVTGLELVTGVLAIAVVRKLTANQLTRARHVAAHGSEPPSRYDSDGVHGELGQPG
jgi:Domain of unknown function (DUF4328)